MKVWAANETMVKFLKHPISKMGFTSMADGVNWPDDTFTHRRIRDGDVTTEDPSGKAEESEQGSKQQPSRGKSSGDAR